MYICPLCGSEDDDGYAHPQDSPIPTDHGENLRSLDDDLVDADEGDAVQRAVPMPAPITPSKSQVEAHNLTHWPYRSWCPHCVAARRPNSHHRRLQDPIHRTIPLLVGDYCFVRDADDTKVAQILVVKIEPANMVLCCIAEQKGEHDPVVQRLTRFIKDTGYSHIAYRSDQEPALRALFEAAFTAANRHGQEIQMVPEASSVGESQSNGKAEAAVKMVEDMLRTYKAALETRIQAKVDVHSPVFHWLLEHVSSIHNRVVCNEDGRTPFETIHGQRWRGKMVEFGEMVHYFVPKKLRAKMSLRWRFGTFVGNSQSTNEVYVAARNGEIIKTRSIVRTIEASRWSKESIYNIVGLPHNLRPKT